MSAVCGFCKGKPVGDAATWVDGKPRPPAPCPRCGETFNPEKRNAPPDQDAPCGYDWLGRPKDPAVEAQRRLSVDQCAGCGPNGRTVRYCPLHGLNGTAPR